MKRFGNILLSSLLAMILILSGCAGKEQKESRTKKETTQHPSKK